MSLAFSDLNRKSAHRLASTTTISVIAAELQKVLGPSLTTVILGGRDPKAIAQWAKGTRTPRPAQENALRALYQVVALLSEVDGPDVIRAWFSGMNPDLEDRSPALTMQSDPVAVMRAAESFIQNG
jgi:hypothetical protein